jgi:hypothetical protein
MASVKEWQARQAERFYKEEETRAESISAPEL